jgi:hypothetical protein
MAGFEVSTEVTRDRPVVDWVEGHQLTGVILDSIGRPDVGQASQP